MELYFPRIKMSTIVLVVLGDIIIIAAVSCASTSWSSQHDEVSDDEFSFSPPLEPLSTEPLAELDGGEANRF